MRMSMALPPLFTVDIIPKWRLGHIGYEIFWLGKR